VKRILMVLTVALVMAAMMVASAAPVFAINDFLVPAGSCAAENSSAVGNTPDGTNPGIATTDQVAPPVSNTNPGLGATGAKGEQNSQAPC
jgi:hypothetical protein